MKLKKNNPIDTPFVLTISECEHRKHRKNNFAETFNAEISSFLIRQGQRFQVSNGNFLSTISGGGQGVVYLPL